MHREYENSINYIYENDFITKGKFEEESMDRNTTRIQSSELTGSDSVRNRSSRAAVVCLVLLCVLLLTAVIVLCVTLTQERQQLLSKNENLTNEREQLMLKNEMLTREREQIKWEKNLQRCLGKVAGWIYYQYHFYYMSIETKSWTESRRYCTERGADLIIINNKEEQEFVENISGYARVWIGLTDSDVEGRWKWVDGSRLNSGFWQPEEPNNYTGNEDCALSYTSGWIDYSCYKAFKWICETSILHIALS